MPIDDPILKLFPPEGSRGRDILDMLLETYENLGAQIFKENSAEERAGLLRRAVTRNLESPLDAVMLATQVPGMGDASEQMRRYGNIDAAYRTAIQNELSSGLRISSSRKIMLEAALEPNSDMNFQLISNRTVRSELRASLHHDFFMIEALAKNVRTTWHLSSF